MRGRSTLPGYESPNCINKLQYFKFVCSRRPSNAGQPVVTLTTGSFVAARSGSGPQSAVRFYRCYSSWRVQCGRLDRLVREWRKPNGASVFFVILLDCCKTAGEVELCAEWIVPGEYLLVNLFKIYSVCWQFSLRIKNYYQCLKHFIGWKLLHLKRFNVMLR